MKRVKGMYLFKKWCFVQGGVKLECENSPDTKIMV